jgi:hypothetical protein
MDLLTKARALAPSRDRELNRGRTDASSGTNWDEVI